MSSATPTGSGGLQPSGAAAGLPVDIVEQDLLGSHRFTFWLVPQRRTAFAHAAALTWTPVHLSAAGKTTIPDTPGVYSLVLQPGIAHHGTCCYLMYIGKSDSLARRFSEYLKRERRPSGRPKIKRLLHKYPDHVWFHYAPVNSADMASCEDALIGAYLPPCNDQFPADVRAAIGAF